MARPTGAAKTLTLTGSAITGMTEYAPKFTEKNEEVKVLTDGYTNRVIKHKGWAIEVKFELPTLSVSAGAISAGGWAGANVEEYDLDIDLKLGECTGQADAWDMYQLTGVDWKFSATKWQATDSLNIFQAALIAQAAQATVTLPFGTYTGILTNSDTAWNDDVGKEKLEIVCADGPIVVGAQLAVLIGYVITDIAAVISGGVATARAVICTEGTGTAFMNKLSVKCPDGHITGSLGLQGSGAFTPA